MIPLFGCHQSYDANATEQFADDQNKGPEKDAAPKPQAKGERFGEEREPLEIKKVDFDPRRAMQYLNDLCAIGTRISGSEGMTKQQELLQKHFEKFGAKVVLQKFDGKQPSQQAAVPMANMIVTWNPDAKRRIMFCGHYDTRPIADQEPRQADWRKTFLSANDGTSTVAFFMELAHHMKGVPLKIGVDFVIFDGEEFINDNRRDKFFLGSNYFANAYFKDKPPYEYIAAVLLDLFAGKGATFPIEENSRFLAGPVVESIWQEANRQGVKSFLLERGYEVQDDHLALNRVQIPAVDIIDFSYKHWHKLSDLPENCSGEKMAEVALVLTAWMQRLK
jgi:glutaminyl-peptide cyclotransferase